MSGGRGQRAHELPYYNNKARTAGRTFKYLRAIVAEQNWGP